MHLASRLASHLTSHLLFVLLSLCLPGFAIRGAAQSAQPIGSLRPAPHVPLGANLAWWTSFSPETVFVDLFKGASNWVSQRQTGGPWDTGEPITFGPDLYPARLNTDQAAAVVINNGIDGRYPGGAYLCLWEGDGTVQLRGDAVETRRSPNRIEATVSPADGVILRIAHTNPGNPVRNIRLIPAASEGTYLTQPFQQRFLQNWAGFSVLRFMDWMRANGSLQRQWSDRPTPALYSQATEAGVALEHMIDLAHAFGADPWFCLPHLADDDYARQFARVIASRLDRQRVVYLEYSNECWHTGFAQGRYCHSEGNRLQLSNDPFEAQLRYYSQRSVQMFRVMEQELRATHRVVRVLCAQAVNGWTSNRMLEWRDAHREVDALAIAPYFGYELGNPARQNKVALMSVQDVLAECWTDLDAVLQGVRRNVTEARRFGVRLIGYEGGQHMVGFGGAENNATLTALFTTANRHMEMFWLYSALLMGWQDAGGQLFVPYYTTGKPNRWGSWGALEHTGQNPLTAPKYMALRAWVEGIRVY